MAKIYKATDKIENITHLKLNVYYSTGDLNYATYKPNPKGICVTVGPVQREELGNMIRESFMGFSGQSYLLEDLTRKSAKKEAFWNAKISAIADDILNAYLATGFAGVQEVIKGIL